MWSYECQVVTSCQIVLKYRYQSHKLSSLIIVFSEILKAHWVWCWPHPSVRISYILHKDIDSTNNNRSNSKVISNSLTVWNGNYVDRAIKSC